MKLFGWGSYLWDFSSRGWSPLWYIVTIRVALSSHKIWSFMITQSKSRSTIIISGIMWERASEATVHSNRGETTDILTKALTRGNLVYFRDKLGVLQNTFLAKKDCWKCSDGRSSGLFLSQWRPQLSLSQAWMWVHEIDFSYDELISSLLLNFHDPRV